MKTITLVPFLHRRVEQVKLQFPNDPELSELVSKADGIRWSTTKNCWYMPLDKKSSELVINAVGGKATVNTEELDGYLKVQKEKSRKFKLPTFIIAFAILCLLALLSSQFQYARDNDTLGSSFIKNRIADIYLVLRFPLHNILWGKMSWPEYVATLGINCMMYAFIIERVLNIFSKPKPSENL
jgi:hypothetical protein